MRNENSAIDASGVNNNYCTLIISVSDESCDFVAITPAVTVLFNAANI